MRNALKYVVAICLLSLTFKSSAQVIVNEDTLPLVANWISIAREQGDRVKATKYYEALYDYVTKASDTSLKGYIDTIALEDLQFIMESYSLIDSNIARERIRKHFELYREVLEYRYGKETNNANYIFQKSSAFISGALLSEAAGLADDAIYYQRQRVQYLDENNMSDTGGYCDALTGLASSYQKQKNDFYTAVQTYNKAFHAALKHLGPDSPAVQEIFDSMAVCAHRGVMNITFMAGKGDEFILAGESTSIAEINKINELWISVLRGLIDKYGIKYYNSLISKHQEIFEKRPRYENNPYASSLYEAYCFKSDVLIAGKNFSDLLIFLESEISKLNYLTISERANLYVHVSGVLQKYKYYDVAVAVLEQRINGKDISEEDYEHLASELLSLYSYTGNTKLISYSKYFLQPIRKGNIHLYNPNYYIDALMSIAVIYGKLNTPDGVEQMNLLGELAYEISKGNLPNAYATRSNKKKLDDVLNRVQVNPMWMYNAAWTYATIKSVSNCLSEAESLYKEAIQINQEYHLLNNNYKIQLDLVQVYAKEHKKEHVDQIVKEVLAQDIAEKDKLSIYDKISLCYWNLGDYHAMKPYLAKWAKLQINDYIASALFMIKENRLSLSWFKHVDEMGLVASSLCSQAGEDYFDYCYDILLANKGLQLSIDEIIREDVISSNYPALIESYKKYKSAERSDSKQTGAYEADFIRQYGFAFPEQGLREFRSWKDVRDKLNDGEVAVEFTLSATAKNSTVVYVALVLAKDSNLPTYIELCPREEIDKMNVDEIVTAVDNGKLYDKIWKPLLSKISGASTIYFSPYGCLNNLPLEYLDKNEDSLQNRKYIRVSTTGKLPSLEHASQYTSATLYGGMEYNADISNVSSRENNINISHVLADSQLTRKGWDYLPGTKKEVENIESILKQYHLEVDTHIGKDGTETSFKRLSGNKKDIIHIATHGFYLSDGYGLNLADSGLLFTGGQNGWSGAYASTKHDDGILLSKEIAGMDLSNTDIVVLSACETALGEISNDGVYGLQRAFKIAGVNSLIMSLWEVNDEATETMMTSFYTNLMGGYEKHEAFSMAIEALKNKYHSPAIWASFIMLD